MYRVTLVLLLLALLALIPARQADARLDASAMKVALRTAMPEEDGFIDRVLLYVDHGTLPESLVDSTFQWARKKSHHQFQYFKRGLTIRAGEIGVKL